MSVWYILGSMETHASKRHPIAYFSFEFALTTKLPIYSGGLGVLAGDVLKEADDQKLPFVGVGLFYNHGYFHQKITPEGEQTEVYTRIETKNILTPVFKNDKELLVEVPIQDRIVYAKVWEYKIGSISLYLLDTNTEKNLADDRDITRYLYGGDADIRIKQEMILGIGGERVLFELDIHPSIYHLNEGHSAFCVFEIAHHVMKETGKNFHDAFAEVQKKIVFTNHTLLPAGNDRFSQDKIAGYLASYATQLKLPVSDMLEKGIREETPKLFSMTQLALTMACRINTVSTSHSIHAKKVWPETPMPGITNGIHLPTWTHSSYKKIAPHLNNMELQSMTDTILWHIHTEAKKELISYINQTCVVKLKPEVATIVWARRFTSYKQPALLFSEIESLKKLSQTAHGALQVIIAGKSHPRDSEGKKLIPHIHELIKKADLSHFIVFVPDYSLETATFFVQGADVWLNTPVPGWEASGTSGMKAGANGVLQCSTRDGWIDEVDLTRIGWELANKNTAQSLYTTITNNILPQYYTFDAGSFNVGWVKKMRETMQTIWENYSTTRLLKDYMEKLYSPAWEQG